MASTIFYGAGEYAQNNFDTWVSEGLLPVCFVDSDIKKQNTNCKGISILPLIIAINRYPDYEIKITVSPQNTLNIYTYLLSIGVDKDRISCADRLEYRKGCAFIGTHLLYDYLYFSSCCCAHRKNIYHNGNFKQAYEEWRKYSLKLIDDLKRGNPTHCDGCQYLTERFYPAELRVEKIGFGSTFPSDVCNFKCIYCIRYGLCLSNYEAKEGHQDFGAVMGDIYALFHSQPLELSFANGEFFANPNCDKILDMFKKTRWKTEVITNGSVAKEQFVELILQKRVTHLNVSLDAGTRETFKTIKQADLFERVVANLRKYADAGAYIDLKYVIVPGINDNEDDVDGFVDIARDVAGFVSISGAYDGKRKSHPLPEHSRNMLRRMLTKLKDASIPINTFNMQLVFHKDDHMYVEGLAREYS